MSNFTNSKVAAEILQKTDISNGVYISEVYKDILTILISNFNNLYYIDRNNNPIKIKCFHANQERAIAKITNGDNVTLPVISISEKSTSNDDKRRRYSPMLVHEVKWDSEKKKAIRILSLAPKAINITYSINIWSKYKQDLDQIRETIFSLFNPHFQIPLKSNQITKSFIESESDSSEVQVFDNDDRILRKNINIRVETYLPSPRFLYTSTGKIENLNYELDIYENIETISTEKMEVVVTPESTTTPNTLATDGLYGFYRFSNPDVVNPDSDQYLVINSQSLNNNAQIVGEL